MKKTLVLVAVCLTSCQTSQMATPEPTHPYSLSASETAAVQEGVRKSLKDPTSPIFGNIKAAASDTQKGIIYVCGIVNAKNSFGGYTGDGPYVGVLASMTAEGKNLSTFNVTGMAGTEIQTSVVMDMCKHYGIVGG
ncbi:hypothetical protein G6L00_16545 [Agrobacterium rhizogenes]|nr:hypothetical protein [Rhizobium rhizogenes]NTH50480.1 hypothetical protein [Rhizobium rhizogenes]NTH70064.1 hypothetical protein [Rhizobium rhizogenes]